MNYLTKEEVDLLKGGEEVTFVDYVSILKSNIVIEENNFLDCNSVAYFMYQVLENIIRITNNIKDNRNHKEGKIKHPDLSEFDKKNLYDKITGLIRGYALMEAIILGDDHNDGHKTPFTYIKGKDQRKLMILLNESRAVLDEVRWWFY